MKKSILILFLIILICFDANAQKENDFQFERISGGRVRITGYSGNAHSVKIPHVIQGMLVTEIGDGAFLEKGLTKVTLPRNLIIIGKEAFKNNRITDIRIPVNVTTIMAQAFKGNRIKVLEIPFNVNTIESEAFTENRIERIRIGAGLEPHANAFDNRFTAVYIFMGQKAGTYLFSNRIWRKK